jgi:hypothetical protein
MTSQTVKVPLRLPAINVEGLDVQRSGIRWLCGQGRRCRPGEVIAWCNIGLAHRPGATARLLPFPEEKRDFQVAFAVRRSGRVVKAPGASRGGFLDLHAEYDRWVPGTVIGYQECAPDEVHEREGLRLLILAGRRMVECAEVRWGPATGWHDRSRAWWAEDAGAFGTLLSLGICEQLGIVRGEQGAFFELLCAAPGPAHVVFVPDDVLVPSAGVLLAQLLRSEADNVLMVEDLARTFGTLVAADNQKGPEALAGWIFAGCLVKALTRSPLLEPYEVLTTAGVRQVGPANAVLLSLHSEHLVYLRHKRLGYLLNCHDYRVQDGGPAFKKWLRAEFEVVRRTPEDVRGEYLQLIDALQARTGAHLLVLNMVSSTERDDVYSYAPFDRPLRDALPGLRAREMNLMLYQLARERDISVVDIDALAVELGIGKHAPDGVHQSGRLQRAVRAELVTILRDRGVKGFAGANALTTDTPKA